MSEKVQQNLECPRCGNKQAATLWKSLDVALDPELKEQLFAAKINLFECEKCEEKAHMNTPLLYHDQTQRFCVQFYPPELVDDPAFLRQFNPDASLTMEGVPDEIKEEAPYMTTPHIVFDMNDMLRYLVFRDQIASVTKG